MFRGTLKLTTFLASLQMVDRICDVAFSLSDLQMQELTWTDFVAGCEAPEIIQYLKERRFYVSGGMIMVTYSRIKGVTRYIIKAEVLN